MSGSMSDLAAKMGQRKQRLQEEQQRFERVSSYINSFVYYYFF